MDPKSDSIQVHHWSPLLDHKGFENPSSSPICLPPKDLCFLPVDGMRSLLDMHGNSILRFLVLDHPSVLCHMDSQHPPGRLRSDSHVTGSAMSGGPTLI